jgi:hypothetical protein
MKDDTTKTRHLFQPLMHVIFTKTHTSDDLGKSLTLISSSVVSSSDVMRLLSNIASSSDSNSEFSSELNDRRRLPEVKLLPLEPVLNEDGDPLRNVKGPLLSGINFPAFVSRMDARLTDPKIFAKGPSRTAILNPRIKTH